MDKKTAPEIRFSTISPELRSAYAHCRKITQSHYENFPVASVLMPRKMRWHVYAIYAFARHADDLADEFADREGLLRWREQLHVAISGETTHPIFLALANTIRVCDLPVSLFDDLLSAFLQDLDKNRYENMAELRDYCRRSANPVGRLILLLNGYRDPERFVCSDAICTALQLTNFWQDVSVDLAKNRVYLPKDFLEKHRISEDQLFAGDTNPAFRDCILALVRETRELFNTGKPLLSSVDFRLRKELQLTVEGGLAILQKIENMNYDVLKTRPKLAKTDWIKLIFRTITSGK